MGAICKENPAIYIALRDTMRIHLYGALVQCQSERVLPAEAESANGTNVNILKNKGGGVGTWAKIRSGANVFRHLGCKLGEENEKGPCEGQIIEIIESAGQGERERERSIRSDVMSGERLSKTSATHDGDG